MDPSAQGLQVTSRNRPKIIGLFMNSCTFMGRLLWIQIWLTARVLAIFVWQRWSLANPNPASGLLSREALGAISKSLKNGGTLERKVPRSLPHDWIRVANNYSEFRVGFVHAYSLFPKSLVGEHRSKRFESFEKVNRDAEMRLSKEGQEITVCSCLSSVTSGL